MLAIKHKQFVIIRIHIKLFSVNACIRTGKHFIFPCIRKRLPVTGSCGDGRLNSCLNFKFIPRPARLLYTRIPHFAQLVLINSLGYTFRGCSNKNRKLQ